MDRIEVDNQFEVIREVRGSAGAKAVWLGQSGRCRYCHRSDPSQFKKRAHLIPESLGNKWIFSRDECDECNDRFALYDGELTNALSAFLTFGGVQGKEGRTRQTGRSSGRSVIAHGRDMGKRSLSVVQRDSSPASCFFADPVLRQVWMGVRVSPIPFKPRLAYKAIAKAGYALLDSSQFASFETLRKWLLNPDDGENIEHLWVRLSVGSIGNAPALASVTLVRPRLARPELPEFVVLLTAGSVCLQIELPTDTEDLGRNRRAPRGVVTINYRTVLGDPASDRRVEIPYERPTWLNWASANKTAQPVAHMDMDLDMTTLETKLVPIFRESEDVVSESPTGSFREVWTWPISTIFSEMSMNIWFLGLLNDSLDAAISIVMPHPAVSVCSLGAGRQSKVPAVRR